MEVSSFFSAWLRNSKTFGSPCTVAPRGLNGPLIVCPKHASRHQCRLDPEFRGGLGEEPVRRGFTVRIEGSGEGCPSFRDAFTAAGAHPELPGKVTQAGGPALDRGADVSVGDRFADANNHGAIVNANANDCQYRLFNLMWMPSRCLLVLKSTGGRRGRIWRRGD